MGPPGLAFVAANACPRGGDRNAAAPPLLEWDLRAGPEGYRRSCGTAPEHAIFALAATLELLFEEGWTKCYRPSRKPCSNGAHRRWSLAGHRRSGIQRHRFNATIQLGDWNPDTTWLSDGPCTRTWRDAPSGWEEAWAAFRAAPFASAHLGDSIEPMILGALAAVDLTLCELGINQGTGDVRAAIEYLASTSGNLANP